MTAFHPLPIKDTISRRVPMQRLGAVPEMTLPNFYRLACIFLAARKSPPQSVCIHGVRIPWSRKWSIGSQTAIMQTIRMLLLRVHRSLSRLPDGWRWMLEVGVQRAQHTPSLAERAVALSSEERWLRHLRAQKQPTDLRWGLGSFPVTTMSRRQHASWSFSLLGVDGWGPDSTFHHLRYLCWQDSTGRHALPVTGDALPAALRSLTPAVVGRAKQAGRQITALPDLSGFIVEARHSDAMRSVLGWRWDPSTTLPSPVGFGTRRSRLRWRQCSSPAPPRGQSAIPITDCAIACGVCCRRHRLNPCPTPTLPLRRSLPGSSH